MNREKKGEKYIKFEHEPHTSTHTHSYISEKFYFCNPNMSQNEM